MKPHTLKLSNGKTVKVNFCVFQTLYDGKCVNFIVGNKATTACPMCFISSYKFGNVTQHFEPKEDSLKLGIGLLHCQINAFEYLLHLVYRETINSWDIRKHLKGILRITCIIIYNINVH